jgi:hypothetical protein
MAKVGSWRQTDKQNSDGAVHAEGGEIMYLLTWSYGGIELEKIVDAAALNAAIDELLGNANIVIVELLKGDK